MKRKAILAVSLLCAALTLQACAGNAATVPEVSPSPTAGIRWPDGKLEKSSEGIPLLQVYVVDDQQV